MGEGGKKAMVVLAPVVAVFLAAITQDASWNPERPWKSIRLAMHPELAESAKKAAADAPVDESADASKDAADAAKKPGDTPSKPPAVSNETDTPGSKDVEPGDVEPGDAEPETKPPEKKPESIKLRAKGLAVHRSPEPLLTKARERLDIKMSPGGGATIDGQFVDPLSVVARVEESDLRETGLLLLMADAKTPWDTVTALLDAAAKAGWKRLALGVCTPEERMYARVLPVGIPPAGDPVEVDIPITTVHVPPPAGRLQKFKLDAEVCDDRPTLEVMVDALHLGEYEGFVPGYSSDVKTTPWIIDGSGASTAGVVQAMDALKAAGVKTWRLKGINGK